LPEGQEYFSAVHLIASLKPQLLRHLDFIAEQSLKSDATNALESLEKLVHLYGELDLIDDINSEDFRATYKRITDEILMLKNLVKIHLARPEEHEDMRKLEPRILALLEKLDTIAAESGIAALHGHYDHIKAGVSELFSTERQREQAGPKAPRMIEEEADLPPDEPELSPEDMRLAAKKEQTMSAQVTPTKLKGQG
jgi:hypothetical protein